MKQLVWSSHCCAGNNSGSRRRDIGRSQDVGRGDGQALALDPPPTKSQAPAATKTTLLCATDEDEPARSSSSNKGSNGSDTVPCGRNVNGGTMGLEPTASGGDRMDLDAPLPPVMKALHTDWPAADSPKHEDEALSAFPPELFPTDNVDDLLDAIGDDMEPEADRNAATNGGGLEALNKLSVAEQQLLRDAADAVMSVVGADDSTAKDVAVDLKLEEVRCRQQQIEQRCQTLLRRAGRLQARHVSRHVADQVSNFVTYAKDTLGVERDSRSRHNGTNLYGWAEDGRLPTREEVRNIPTATLVNLVSRLQAPPVSYLSSRRYFALSRSSASAASCGRQVPANSSGAKTGVQLSTHVAQTLEEVAGLWEAQLRYLQRRDDPDATESSSGGESDDDVLLVEQQAAASDAPDAAAAPPAKPVST